MQITLKSNAGYDIPCICEIPQNTDLTVIALHGFGGNKNTGAIRRMGKKLLEFNKGMIAFDLPCHGDSNAQKDAFLLKNVIDDIDSVVSFVENEYPHSDIAFFATSFGAYATHLYLSENNEKLISKALCRSSAIDMEKVLTENIIKGRTEELEKNGYIDLPERSMPRVSREYRDELSRNRLFDVFRKNDFCDYLMIHGEKDEIAPVDDARAFAQRFGINMIEVAGADHRFKKEYDLELLINYSMNFFLQ